MKLLPLFACILGAAAGGSAQDGAGMTIDGLAGAAAEELAKSVAELNALRDQIAAEKLPLAQELSALEERITALRREYDQISRQIDAGNLDAVKARAEIQARKDELSYVGNLLDEYVRSFESKLHVGELQTLGSAIDAAKRAGEDQALPMTEKFHRQVTFAGITLQRLFDALGGRRFSGQAVDLQGSVVRGQFAVFGPVALFSAGAGAAGLALPQTGSSNPLVRPLDQALQPGIAALVDQGEGLLPLDPSRGGALAELVEKFNLIHTFEEGGPIMWPLLLASILALGTVLERLFFLASERRKRDPEAVEQLFAAVERDDLAAAIRTGKESKSYVARTLGYALEHREGSLSNALLYAQARELKRFQRGIPILDTVITLAPLLGLLGTVTGMMNSFSLISGELGAPGAITGGIAEALIATAFGLGIAITCLIPFNFLNAKQEQARHEIESAATQLELLVKARQEAPPSSAPARPAPVRELVEVA